MPTLSALTLNNKTLNQLDDIYLELALFISSSSRTSGLDENKK